MDYKDICNKVREITIDVGKFIKQQGNEFNTESIEIKGTNEFVSYVDKQAEQKLVTELGLLIPESGFIAEEGTSNKKGEKYNWIIDPLDGTTNFIHGLPPFSVSIALMADKEIVVGVIYEINTDECFYAWQGSKAYMNGNEINVSQTSKVNDALIATGFPYREYSKLSQFMQSMTYFMKNSHGLRRLGSAAIDLAYVACGKFDAFYEYSLCAWDVAAGALIVKQAGGKVCDFNGGDDYLFGQEFVAANNNIFDEFSTTIKKIMN